MLRPRFQPHYCVEVLEEGVFLLSEAPAIVLDGRLYKAVAPLIDGRRTVDEIVSALAGHLDPSYVHWTLGRLEKQGHITESEEKSGSTPRDAAREALWTSDRLVAEEAEARLERARCRVIALTPDPDPLETAFEAAGVRLTTDEAADLTVVVTSDYLHHALDGVNKTALETSRPWMLVRPVGAELWIGPLFRPGKTGCWECLATRLRGNRGPEWFVRERLGFPESYPVARAATLATRQIAWSIAATEAASFLARGGSSALEGKVLSLDVRTWRSREHLLVHRPTCPACGDDVTRAEPRKIVLSSIACPIVQDGGYRAVSSDHTIERYAHHLSPITGALAGVERVGPSDDGVSHVYFAGANNARLANGSFEGLRFNLRNKNSGKGTSDANARASAIGEGLERWSGVFHGTEPRRRGRLRDLEDEAIHPNDCMLFSAKQYETRDVWNANKWRLDWVPVPLDPDREVEWTPAWSLTRSAFRLLPTGFCFYGYPFGPSDRDQFCVACSTGNAAGNTIEEAILQGFFELVERDAVALWWYNRVRRPAVDLDAFDDPYLSQIREVYRSKRHRDLFALDLTSDLGVPVVAAVSRRTDGLAEKIMFGFGAHFDRRVATLRAVTELNQMLAMFLPTAGEERGPEPIDPAPTIKWLATATLATETHLAPLAPLAPSATATRPRTESHGTGDLREDVLRCQQIVEGAGLEMLVLDQTRAEIGLPVVKVVVPGLRHFWARFGPGRLFDVPVRLGWIARPHREDELNPTAMFL